MRLNWKTATIALTMTLTLLVAPLFVGVVSAQDGSSLLAPAVPVNQQYVQQIDSGLAGQSLASVQSSARTAFATGATLVGILTQVQTAATDDATRSRAAGLLSHIQASQASLTAALGRSDLSSALSDLDAARAEAVEAQSEVAAFATTVPATSVPVATKTPAATAVPAATSARVTTAVPAATSARVTTAVPTATSAPVTTAVPAATSARVTTAVPTTVAVSPTAVPATPVATAAAPTALPVTGGPGPLALLPLAGLGFGLAGFGRWLRRNLSR